MRIQCWHDHRVFHGAIDGCPYCLIEKLRRENRKLHVTNLEATKSYCVLMEENKKLKNKDKCDYCKGPYGNCWC